MAHSCFTDIDDNCSKSSGDGSRCFDRRSGGSRFALAYVPASGYCFGYGCKTCPVTYTVCSIQKNVFCRSDHGSSISPAAVCASDRCGIWNYGAEDHGTYVSEASSCYSKVQEKETVVIRFLYHHNISVFHRKNKSKGR